MIKINSFKITNESRETLTVTLNDDELTLVTDPDGFRLSSKEELEDILSTIIDYIKEINHKK